MAKYYIDAFDKSGQLNEDNNIDEIAKTLKKYINECINYIDVNGECSLKSVFPYYEDGELENFFAIFESEEETEEVELILSDEKESVLEYFYKSKAIQIMKCNKIIYNEKTYIIKDKIFSISENCTQLICELIK